MATSGFRCRCCDFVTDDIDDLMVHESLHDDSDFLHHDNVPSPKKKCKKQPECAFSDEFLESLINYQSPKEKLSDEPVDSIQVSSDFIPDNDFMTCLEGDNITSPASRGEETKLSDQREAMTESGFKCPCCNFLTYDKDDLMFHESLHDASDFLHDNNVPSPEKKCKIQLECAFPDEFIENLMNYQSPNKELSDEPVDSFQVSSMGQLEDPPLPGPSNISVIPSDSVIGSEENDLRPPIRQSGRGGSDQNVDSEGTTSETARPLTYRITKKSERTFRNTAIDRHYDVKFNINETIEGQPLSRYYEEIENMFNNVIEEGSEGLQNTDLGRVIIHHEDLSNPIYVPLRPLEELSGRLVMDHLQNVLNSHEKLPLDHSFRVDFGTIQIPSGGAKALPINTISGTDNSIHRKKSIIEIKNDDNTCLASAIAIGFARANCISKDRWVQITREDYDKNIHDLVLKYKKCPDWFYKNLTKRDRRKGLWSFVRYLCAKAAAPTDKILTIRDIPVFEKLLHIDVLVVSARMGNAFLKIPPKDSNRPRVYLYLIGQPSSGHFHTITNICGFFGQSKFCHSCLKPYQKKHKCSSSCMSCKEQNCVLQITQVSCIRCHVTCRSYDCFLRHKTKRQRKGNEMMSECELYWKCTKCKVVIDRKKREPTDHRCGEWLCKCCNNYVDSEHLCYVRALEPRESKSKYIFFDFECSQEDHTLTCKEGTDIHRNPHCPSCKEKEDSCHDCRLCVNCRQSWCGKYKHYPNLVIAQSVCDHCIDAPSEEMKCGHCGQRCSKCDKFDKKEEIYIDPPCENKCGGREVIFKGNETSKEFGQWLFNERHKGFTAIAHNMKGYDGYFLLEYLIDQSIKPDRVIYAGSKIMHMHIARGLNIRVLDSLNFLPMKLSQLPGAFCLTELKKGYFPHYFNNAVNQTYAGPYPAPHYYGCDSMSGKDRDAFMKWYEDKTENGKVFDFDKEIVDYCRSDVDILKQACLTFRKILMEITGKLELELNEDGEMKETLVGGLDPFNEVTIASVCVKVFRTKFLKEKWKVKLRQGDQVTDWLQAYMLNGELKVFHDETWSSGQQLQEKDYTIEESCFVSSPIAQVPSQGYTCRDQYSKISIEWLEWLMEKSRRQGKPRHIRHALNGGEVHILGTKYKLDGYEAPSEAHPQGIAYEFLGYVKKNHCK